MNGTKECNNRKIGTGKQGDGRIAKGQRSQRPVNRPDDRKPSPHYQIALAIRERP